MKKYVLSEEEQKTADSLTSEQVAVLRYFALKGDIKRLRVVVFIQSVAICIVAITLVLRVNGL